MKIAQFYEDGRIRLGLVEDGILTPLDFEGDMRAFIGSSSAPGLLKNEARPLGQVRLASPVTHPDKIIGIGLNYKDHAAEQNLQYPDTPRIFAKFSTTLIGNNDSVTWDVGVTRQVDFEAELAVIIGKTIKNCPESEALGAVFGYTCANDVSARDIQNTNGQIVRGKSLDTFCPLGPWIVTADELPDPNSLGIRCWLNGRLMQDGRTAEMIFSVASLVSFLSRHFTLVPGDIVLTGSPKGVGAFRNPPVFLKGGDEVVVEIEGIGRLVNTCKTL